MITAIGCSSSGELTDTEEQVTEVSNEQPENVIADEEEVVTEPEDTKQSELEDQQLAIAENGLKMQFQSDANNITHLYVTAQQLFYNGNSEEALILIQQANEIRGNADVKALKGSIYLSLGNREKFEENWRKAFELDSTVPVPSIPVIERELKNLGLID